MTEPIDVAVQTALLTHLASPELTDPSTPVAYPLVDYTPAPGTAYFKVQPILRAAPESPFLAWGSSVIYSGILQVDAVVPAAEGEAPGLRLAAAVVERFARGTALDSPVGRIHVVGVPSIATAIRDDAWNRFPVSVRFTISA